MKIKGFGQLRVLTSTDFSEAERALFLHHEWVRLTVNCVSVVVCFLAKLLLFKGSDSK